LFLDLLAKVFDFPAQARGLFTIVVMPPHAHKAAPAAAIGAAAICPRRGNLAVPPRPPALRPGSGDSFSSGGRFQTCILVDSPGCRFAIDFGTSSLIALGAAGHRPQLDRRHPAHASARIELEPGRSQSVLDLTVTAPAARHTKETNPTALRVEVAGKVVSYTGDTVWTDDVAKVTQGADLFVAECDFYEKPIEWHLRRARRGARLGGGEDDIRARTGSDPLHPQQCAQPDG
jgi:hypothetical protein